MVIVSLVAPHITATTHAVVADVKAPNIFLGSDGSAHLGDLGAAREAGGDADERTKSHLPHDMDLYGIDNTKPSAACDMVLLAVTLLERMGLLKLNGRQGIAGSF